MLLVRNKMGKWEIKHLPKSTGHLCLELLEVLPYTGVFVETLAESLIHFIFAVATLLSKMYLFI